MDYPELVAGVDPGQTGGIAFIGRDFAVAYKMPETRKDTYELILEFHDRVKIAYVELVRSSPQMGVTSSFTFGCNYERVVMALTCCGVPLEEVIPRKWQKALGCLTRGDKRVSKARAQALFPSLKITNYVADALLIAEYGRRLNNAG